TTSGYLGATGGPYTDSHTSTANSITANYSRVVNQAHAFIDTRSNSRDICMRNSGYTITRSANAAASRFTVTKAGAGVTVASKTTGTTRDLTCTVGAGATDPAGGITHTFDRTAPAITSGNKNTFISGVHNSFTVRTTGSPAPTLTRAGTLPAG